MQATRLRPMPGVRRSPARNNTSVTGPRSSASSKHNRPVEVRLPLRSMPPRHFSIRAAWRSSRDSRPVAFGGPFFTLLKAITTIQLARRVALEHRTPAVAVFWVDAEDHDWQEVAQLHGARRQSPAAHDHARGPRRRRRTAGGGPHARRSHRDEPRRARECARADRLHGMGDGRTPRGLSAADRRGGRLRPMAGRHPRPARPDRVRIV